MKEETLQSRRNFIGLFATGAVATGISLLPNSLQAKIKTDSSPDFAMKNLGAGGAELDEEIKKIGKKQHPVSYDISQANHWGFIWSNVYYMTNAETGTPGEQLGIFNVLRHHGMLFALNDQTIAKYKLGEFFGFNDPITKKPTLKNPYYIPEDGVFPLPGLAGIKDLQEQGAVFCVCDMARKVNSMFVAQKMGLNQEEVYQDFVAGTLPGILPAPSGVWALGRLAENKIAYIDSSIG
ncbi:Tat (twin-arginine translocation) pathway signal sequence containing protein [Algoriphagus pacificus]|uniref:Tat (Twin-arginine translocation) pathway signal sequence containing protein n=1 Tax=Algoriphagus pacificus TaxID=2811234 RepID=A0ABS3CBS6_9BACT|nr:Tat (twin-arginine translocation) pathway signal sequence containing protein [Algoriphagus pacificus]MBN7814558.1 Tat (twin-arginine translocation) pathway signal sequence containing protein [Algoriphagus pacificus]